MKYKKIFVIGFNKTASTTLHNLFGQLGYKSQHNGKSWDLDKYDCLSDNGDLQNLKTLYNVPDSLFILNTRNLNDWLISRSKHCAWHNKYEPKSKFSWGWPPCSDIYIKWIKERENHFKKVMKLFQKDKERLLVVSINRTDWIRFVANNIGHNYTNNIASNQINIEDLNKEDIDLINQELNKCYAKLKYKDWQKKIEFLGDNSILESYANNMKI